VHSNGYTFRFAAIVTIVCSVLLAGAATILKPLQEENERVDVQKNILASVGIVPEEGQSFSKDKISELYQTNIKELVVDTEGRLVEGKKPSDLEAGVDTGQMPLYEYILDGEIQAYVFPVSGKGLWSTIYGYIALDVDAETVRGITFYKHGETPGLGGEVEKEWFTDNFKGKRIFDENGNLVSITVVKGKVEGTVPESEAWHYVDGISGSTLTARGVTNFLKSDLKKYEPFLREIRKSGEGDING